MMLHRLIGPFETRARNLQILTLSAVLISAASPAAPQAPPETDSSNCESIDARLIIEICTKPGDVSCPPVGECTSECLETEHYIARDLPTYGPGPSGPIVGIVAPDGTQTIWAERNWQYIRRERDTDGVSHILRYEPVREYLDRVVVNAPNPVAISINDRDSVVVDMRKPVGGSQTVAPGSASEGDEPRLLPVPYLTLNGSPLLQHLLFVDDDGQVELRIRNNAPADEGTGDNDPCSPVLPPGDAMVVQITVSSPRHFLKDLKSQTITLAPQKEATIKGEILPYLDIIKNYNEDILFGANMTIKIWPASDSDTVLLDRSINIYRYLDVADDNHADGVVAMARTLADGPGKVMRKRSLKLNVHELAAMEWDLEEKPGFDVTMSGDEHQFVFDPESVTSRTESAANAAVKVKEDNSLAGSLTLLGFAEPPQKIRFNESALIETMAEIVRLSHITQLSQKDATSFEVHPALVPPVETQAFDSRDKIIDIAVAVKFRMEELYGDLFSGLKWVDIADAETIDLTWELRENKRESGPGSSFVMGKAFGALDDTNKVDNWDGITRLVAELRKYNEAEGAFRLSQAINPSIGKNVYIFPDSMLEGHRSFGANTISLGSADEIVNAFAKTAVHEISHTMSLRHPVQVGVRTVRESEFQFLEIFEQPTGSFRLGFHGAQTEPIDFYGADSSIGVRILEALYATKTIGFKNWVYEQKKNDMGSGVLLWRCSSTTQEKPPRVLELCDGFEAEDYEPIFIVEFVNHLGGINVDELTVLPPGAGVVNPLQDGTMDRPLKVNRVGVRALADIAFVDRATIESDIMYGGYNDVEGKLEFRSGVSLEVLKMALAMNYTDEDVRKAIAYFQGLMERHAHFGGVF